MERKYRQRGYSDRDAQDKKRDRADRPDRPFRGRAAARSKMRWGRDAADGGNGDARTLRELRRGIDGRLRSEWRMPAVQDGAALLQTVRAISTPDGNSNARSRFWCESRRRMRRTIVRFMSFG